MQNTNTFLMDRQINNYKEACREFARTRSKKASMRCDEIANTLIGIYGVLPSEVERLEIDAMEGMTI